MRKIIILTIMLMSICIVGCTNSKVEKAQSLEEAYFDTLDKRINKEEITEKYLRNLLEGYEYEKGEPLIMEEGNIDGSNYFQQPYIFTNNKEKLTLTHSNYGGNEIVEPFYSVVNENTSLSLSYMERTENHEGNDINNFMVFINSSDIKIHDTVTNKLFDKSSNWSEIYQIISANMASTKDINIETIKELIKEEPIIEEFQDSLGIYQNDPNTSQKYNLVSYNFENENEIMIVEYIKEKSQIWNVYYLEKNTGTNKNTIDKPLINDKEKFHTGLATYVKTKEIQKELIDILQISNVN